MATTPRPFPSSSSLSLHRRPPFSSLTDTPTPASSSSSTHSISMNNLLSLNNNNQNKQPPTASTSRLSKPLKPLNSRFNNISNTQQQQSSIDSLVVEPIQPDDTELQRKEHELSFERMMQELQDARISSSGSEATSRGGARQFGDEEAGSRSSDFTEDDDEEEEEEDGSIRIGLSGIRYRHDSVPTRNIEQEEEIDVHDSDELTYMTVPRSQLDPLSPAKPTTRPPLSSTNVFTSSSNPSPVPSPRRYTTQSKENLPPPAPAPTTSFQSTRRPFLSTYSASPPPAPINVAPLQSQYRSSPLNPLQNSPILASTSSSLASNNLNHQKTNSFGSNTGTRGGGGGVQNERTRTMNSNLESSSSPKTTMRTRGGGKPVTIEEVSDKGTPPRPNPPQTLPNSYESPVRSRGRLVVDTPGGGGRSVRLPDMTFLTEALESPLKVNNERQTMSGTRRIGGGIAKKTSSSQDSTKSKEAPLISSALSTLNSKLSRLERENEVSSNRVRQLEAQLVESQQESDSRRRRRDRDEREVEEEMRVREEMGELLRGERERREELERVVRELQQEQQERTIPAPVAATRTTKTTVTREACSTAIELKDEVKDLKFGLQSLGYEVEGVRGVVEGLLRDKEEKLEERRWSLEEEERRRILSTTRERERERQRGEVGTDERPGTPRSDAGESEFSRTSSFVSAQEVERLRQEQLVEVQRRTPKKEHADKRHSSRPHTRPRRALSVASSYDSAHDSTYSPSLGSSHSTTSTVLTAPSESSSSFPEEAFEPDFERAERIFEDVERAERRERRERLRGEQEAATLAAATAELHSILEDKSEELCKRCLGKKRSQQKEHAVKEKEKEREKEKRAAEKERAEKEKAKKEEERVRAREKKKLQEREEHCRTLQAVLERLEDDFASQKKIYLELTVEYQSMGSRASTRKRRALADHLKLSIDVLEEKAKDVKQYADALEDLYHLNLAPSSSKPVHSHHRH